MKYIYTIIGIVLIIIGWLIPIDGPFDPKPEDIINQYEQTKPHKGLYFPIQKEKYNKDIIEIEQLEENTEEEQIDKEEEILFDDSLLI